MITFLLKLLLLGVLFFMIKRVYEMIQYNPNAVILQITKPSQERIQTELKYKSPLKLSFPQTQSTTIQDLNQRMPGYMIQEGGSLVSLNQLTQSDTYSIHKNRAMIQDFQLDSLVSVPMDMLCGLLSCDKTTSLSLYRGPQDRGLQKIYRELYAIQCLSGEIEIYVFNPKHETDIKGKDIQDIKKWGMKETLTDQQMIVIPTEWYYYINSPKEATAVFYEADTIATWVFNSLRRK